MESYSLTFVLGKPNKSGTCKIYLRFYSKPPHDYLLFDKTFRVKKSDFNPDNLKAPVRETNPNHAIFNSNLNKFRIEVEGRIPKLPVITKEGLEGKKATADRLVHFIEDFVAAGMEEIKKIEQAKKEGKNPAKPEISAGRLKHYTVVANKIEKFDAKVTFQQIGHDWMKKFENSLRSTMSQNTLDSKISILIAVLNKAKDAKLINKEQFEGYTRPGEEEVIPEFLEEDEIEAFYNVVKSTTNPDIKTSGYYFLLSCYAGYRISDLYTFNYQERIRGSKIILRAKKNGAIVSIPIYPRLAEILEYCKEDRISVSEQEFREHVKLIAKLAGIHGRNIKPHSGRHTFGMMFTEKGFTIEEVAEMLGDSVSVARRYARITNKRLHNRVLNVMGG